MPGWATPPGTLALYTALCIVIEEKQHINIIQEVRINNGAEAWELEILLKFSPFKIVLSGLCSVKLTCYFQSAMDVLEMLYCIVHFSSKCCPKYLCICWYPEHS